MSAFIIFDLIRGKLIIVLSGKNYQWNEIPRTRWNPHSRRDNTNSTFLQRTAIELLHGPLKTLSPRSLINALYYKFHFLRRQYVAIGTAVDIRRSLFELLTVNKLFFIPFLPFLSHPSSPTPLPLFPIPPFPRLELVNFAKKNYRSSDENSVTFRRQIEDDGLHDLTRELKSWQTILHGTAVVEMVARYWTGVDFRGRTRANSPENFSH